MSEEEAWNEGYVQGLNDANRSIKLGQNIRTENPFCKYCKCNLKYPTAVHIVDCYKDNMIENVEDWKPGQIVLFNDNETISALHPDEDVAVFFGTSTVLPLDRVVEFFPAKLIWEL